MIFEEYCAQKEIILWDVIENNKITHLYLQNNESDTWHLFDHDGSLFSEESMTGAFWTNGVVANSDWIFKNQLQYLLVGMI